MLCSLRPWPQQLGKVTPETGSDLILVESGFLQAKEDQPTDVHWSHSSLSGKRCHAGHIDGTAKSRKHGAGSHREGGAPLPVACGTDAAPANHCYSSWSVCRTLCKKVNGLLQLGCNCPLNISPHPHKRSPSA